MSSNLQYRFSRQSHHLGQRHEPNIWQRIHIDPWLTLLLLALCCIGLTILYSASTQNVSMVMRQMVSYVVAFAVMFTMAQIPPTIYRSFTPIFYVLGLFLLVLVELIGEVRMGAQRWINLPGFGSVQPSEFMKLGMPMMCAWFLSRRELPPSWTLNPDADAQGAGWNIIQSKTAIGSGGITGKGYLDGTQSHLHFLPEGHTDFIIAAFSEEFGLVGVMLLMFIYACLLSRALFIAFTHPDNYSRLLAGAIAMSFFVYIFVNVGMVGGILPVVGVPLPFISYGGTAIVTLMAGFGLLMSIHTHRAA